MAQPHRTDPNAKTAAAAKQLRYTIISRMAKALAKEFTIISDFKSGYRNKEDISKLPPYVLVVGSQNVLTNNAEQIAVRNGYQLDGPAASQNTYGIDSGYDFNTHSLAGIQNLRKWGTNLEMRYVNPVTQAVTWVNLLSNLIATNVANFTDFWNGTISTCLFVNGGSGVYQWSGASASYASSTSNSITASGVNSLANLNFNSAGNIVIDGVTYAYTSAGLVTTAIYSQNPTTNKIRITTSQWNSQLFTTGASATQIINAVVPINSNQISNITANIKGALYTDNAGVPGILITSTIASIPASFSSGDFDLTFNFNWPITAATNYHLVISLISSDGVVTLSNYTGNTPAIGTNISTNSGVSWSTQTGYLNAVVNENDSNLQTFNGVSPDPTGAGIVVGDAIVQPPILATTSVTSAPLPTFDLISTFRNQIYYGSFISQTVYITKVNSFTDATFSTPRIVGEGANVTLDAPPTALIAQSDGMYLSAGRSFWYNTKFTLSADLTKESFEINRLKTSSNQSAVSQSYVNKFKNSIVYISFESIFNALGPVKNVLADVQVVNMSDGIKNDMNAYTFTGGSVHYFDYNLYFSCPANNVVRIYNINNKYWEAPQVMPVGIFYEVAGVLCGHDGSSDQSYQLFVPGLYRDNNSPINAIAAFPYTASEGAQPNQKKFFNKHYTEGYIAGNTVLTLQFNYEFGGFSGNYSVNISGADPNIIFNKITDGSLGQNTLGTQPIGTILNLPNQPPVPKFRVINTFSPTSAFETQTVYSSYALDYNWTLIRLGSAIGPARDGANQVQE